MAITFPDTTDIIDEIRNAIGREVLFATTTLSGCSVCDLDPITDTSMDSFCPVCSGEYWIKTYSFTSVSGHITWNSADLLNWFTGGQLFEGDCRVQIKYTQTNLDLVDDAEYLVVDGKRLTIQSKILRGVQNLNRIILNLEEKERTNG